MNVAPERRMWGAALALLIQDAIFWVSDKEKKQDHHREAFNDLCFCGVITKRLCQKTDIDPAWLSEQFRKYLRVSLSH